MNNFFQANGIGTAAQRIINTKTLEFKVEIVILFLKVGIQLAVHIFSAEMKIGKRANQTGSFITLHCNRFMTEQLWLA